VARSQELVTTLSLFAVIAVLWMLGSSIYARMVEMLDLAALFASQTGSGDKTILISSLYAIYDIGVAIHMPVLGICILMGIAANYIQFGSVFSLENLMPKLDKISPGSGFKRIFSMKQVVEIIKSIVKIVFLTILLYIVMEHAIGAFITSVYCGMNCLLQVMVSMLLMTFALSGLAFVIVAIADFAYQKHTFIKGLMMTKEEVKREYKESEGDPVVKGQRKQFAFELIMSDQVGQARKSTAVVINPTHLAVAIRFSEDTMPLPMVVAKGRDLNAVAIRAAAEEEGVPIFRNVPLARNLFADTEPGQYIPDETFEVVAEILAWVANNRDVLYRGPLGHGVLDMEAGDHVA
jgi:type III secretion protein U